MLRARLMVGALVALVVTLFVRMAAVAPSEGPNPTPAPELTFSKKWPGLPEKLSDLKGKVVVLDFWATWCGPCRMSIPELEKTYKKYKGRGLEIIGISTDDEETRNLMPKARKAFGMTYPIVMAIDMPEVADKFPSPSLPMMYIIDKKGMIRERVAGWGPGMSLDDTVEKLLNE